MPDVNSRNVEEIVIPPEKRQQYKTNNLRFNSLRFKTNIKWNTTERRDETVSNFITRKLTHF